MPKIAFQEKTSGIAKLRKHYMALQEEKRFQTNVLVSAHYKQGDSYGHSDMRMAVKHRMLKRTWERWLHRAVLMVLGGAALYVLAAGYVLIL